MSDRANQHKICLLFDVYMDDELSIANFNVLIEYFDGICDVYAMYHGSNSGKYPAANTIELDDDSIFRSFPHNKTTDKGLIPGNWDLKLLAAFERLPDYNLYIRWEFDVICVNEPREVLRRLLREYSHVDFAASYYTHYSQNGWDWWGSLRIPSECDNAVQIFGAASFLPLSIFSRRFLRGYRQCIAAGWDGHGEVNISSAARYLELTVGDISIGDNPFVRKETFGIKAIMSLNACGDFIHPIKKLHQLSDLDNFQKFRGISIILDQAKRLS